MNVRGASFLITGASGGIGHATAIELARRGGRLLVCGRDSGALEKVRGEAVELGTTARAFTGDLSSAQGVRALADGVLHSGVVPDVIVNVAGQLSFAPIEAEDAETAERLFRVNVLAPIEMARAFTPVFKKRGSGLIVNVGSIFGSIGFPYFATYSATKFALRGFSEALRRELKDSGVRYGAAFVGVFGGLASSTATTLLYARQARALPAAGAMAALVIVIANLVMVMRVGAIAAVVAPGVAATLLRVIVPALVLGALGALWLWRQLAERAEAVLPTTGNPTELKTALGFGAVYALVLLAAAWLSDFAGNRGLYVLAFVSGLTDVDAITLSSLRLYALERLELVATVTAVGIAMLANLCFKLGLASVIGGRALALRAAAGMASVALGLLAGLAWVGLG
jgi:short-subunit dehydrogenase